MAMEVCTHSTTSWSPKQPWHSSAACGQLPRAFSRSAAGSNLVAPPGARRLLKACPEGPATGLTHNMALPRGTAHAPRGFRVQC